MLLVKHFGLKRVRNAVARIPLEGNEETPVSGPKGASRSRRSNGTDSLGALDAIRGIEPEKRFLLTEFLRRLRGRKVLPETQDIRQFAQIIGLKEINGKSREDMLPKLIRFLADKPLESLRADIESANGISEQQRQMGFSLLTDKLLGKS